MLVSILSWIVFGALVGWVTSLVIRTQNEPLMHLYVPISIAGAMLSGLMLHYFMGRSINSFSVSSLIIAVVGSIVFVAFFQGFNRIDNNE